MPHIKYLPKKILEPYYKYICFHLKTTMKSSVLLFKHSLVVLQIKISSTILTTESQTQLNWLQTVGKTANTGFAAGSWLKCDVVYIFKSEFSKINE